ncbi:MAG: hypothetical protein KDC90_17455 [Ignavibacteriae bacterium]|nr:hypothetical protein [Ignavibacteriota bacterium]
MENNISINKSETILVYGASFGAAFGAALGAALGAIFESIDITYGISIGIILGVTIALVFGKKIVPLFGNPDNLIQMKKKNSKTV